MSNYVLNVNKTIRPSLSIGNLYVNFSSQVSSTTSKILSSQVWVVDALESLDISLRILLDQSLLNAPNISNMDSSITTSAPSLDHQPAWLKTQLGGLLFVICIAVAGAALYKRKMLYAAKRQNAGFQELKDDHGDMVHDTSIAGAGSSSDTKGKNEMQEIVEMVNIEKTQKQSLV